MRAAARLISTSSRWSLDIVKDLTIFRVSNTRRQGRQPMRAAARLISTSSRWSLDIVKDLTIFRNSNTGHTMKRNIVVAVTGASGSAYAVRLLEVLLAAGCDIDLIISAAGQLVRKQELDLAIDLDNFNAASLMLDCGESLRDPKLQSMRAESGISADASNVLGIGAGEPGRIRFHHFRNYLAPIASGSCLTDGMVICPCSSGTLSAIVHGTSVNLIHRAAEVHLKERRRLILVPRETPLSLIQIQNMKLAVEAGAVMLPASPGFYHGVKLIGDLVDFVVSRICDQLGIANSLIQRWGQEHGDESSEGE
jgi:flavin prenyltransferase